MDSKLHSVVLAIAESVHSACATSLGGSAGNCKDATLALALALEPVAKHVAICQGEVAVDGVVHEHYWCRIDDTIIDPTADQFRKEHGPLIATEVSVPHYKETSFFVFNPAYVIRLFRSLGLN